MNQLQFELYLKNFQEKMAGKSVAEIRGVRHFCQLTSLLTELQTQELIDSLYRMENYKNKIQKVINGAYDKKTAI